MVAEMSEAGLTDQAIADLAGLDQGHLTRIRNGDRQNLRFKTWEAVNNAYLQWQASQALANKAGHGLGEKRPQRPN